MKWRQMKTESESFTIQTSLYCCHMTCVCRVLQQLRALVAMNENLKKQEQQFKAHCKVGQTVVLSKRVYYGLKHHFCPPPANRMRRLDLKRP